MQSFLYLVKIFCIIDDLEIGSLFTVYRHLENGFDLQRS